MTIKTLRVEGIYEDGTQFAFRVDRDSKANQKFFELANEFAQEFQKLVEE